MDFRGDITSRASSEQPESGFRSLLRGSALVAVAVGALGSVAFTLRAGHRNKSLLLMALFVVWVLSPFAVLVWSHLLSKRWSAITRITLHWLMLVVPLYSLALYGTVALGPPRAKTASMFVVVPPASWLLIAIVLLIAAVTSRKLSRRGQRNISSTSL